jgi:hypothetical protein
MTDGRDYVIGGSAGLTKKEFFAAMALAGLGDSGGDDGLDADHAANIAAGRATALIKALNEDLEDEQYGIDSSSI